MAEDNGRVGAGPASVNGDRTARLRERYALTLQEARVALLIADGKTAKEVAAMLDVSVFTVRAHLRNIFAKTGVGRQAALVGVVLAATEVTNAARGRVRGR
jgi:DNA-binding CsgD family transcriptional regulator